MAQEHLTVEEIEALKKVVHGQALFIMRIKPKNRSEALQKHLTEMQNIDSKLTRMLEHAGG